MELFLAVLVVILAFLSVLIVRAFLFKAKAPKLAEKVNYIDGEKATEYINVLQKMIQCKTIYNTEQYEDLEFAKLRDVMKTSFPLIHEKAEVMIFSEDCWVYKITGKDTSRNMMLMSHHDVVKAEEQDWEHDSFSGMVSNHRIWGRGTVDTKSPLFAEFMAVEELLKEGFVPPVNIYIASSHNEEVGGNGIPVALQYFKEQNIKFEFVLDEGGAIIDPPLGGMNCKCAMLAVHEKGRHTIECVAKENSFHAGLSPKKDTPITRMSAFIHEVSSKNIFIRRIYPELESMFEGLCPYMPFGMRIVFANLWCFKPLLKIIIPKLNEQAAAMLGTTASFNAVIGGKYHKDHQNECKSTIFLRCVHDEDLKADIAKLKKIAEKYHITLTDVKEGNEYYPPANMALPTYGFVKDCVKAVFPYVAVAPFILPAGTDARHLTDICNCVIRFAPIDIDQQQFKSVHGVNENIHIDSVCNAVYFYKYLLEHLQ